jgi:hypothetical protein
MKGGRTAPPGWNKTIDDLFAELKSGARKGIPGWELDWARDYERSLLPADTRFPARGDVYEAKEDMELDYVTSWAAPFSGGGKAVLRRGEQVAIPDHPLEPRPVLVYARPVEYKELEARVVPLTERQAPKYGGFSFAIKTADLNQNFRLVDEAKGLKRR